MAFAKTFAELWLLSGFTSTALVSATLSNVPYCDESCVDARCSELGSTSDANSSSKRPAKSST